MVKKNKSIAIFAVVIVCAVLVFSLLGTFPTFLKEERHPIDISTSNDIGVNLAKDKIHFGVIKPGTSSKRDFQLYNSADYPVKAVLGCERLKLKLDNLCYRPPASKYRTKQNI
jgi:hypothetical protein